tara:strand:+ start:57 stop:968 length:912 start_codon:yes stop_codon:yes gene_type:complete
MKTVVVGLGVQGQKRVAFAKKDFYASVDPYNSESDFRCLKDVPTNKYDSVMLCVPDKAKEKIIEYCINMKKNILVEKPLVFTNIGKFNEIEEKANRSNVKIYTAYNHRFEPHLINVKKYLNSGKLGKIFRCKLYYGNGTARLVKESSWRDKGSGVIHDLGSHLLDTLFYWFGNFDFPFSLSFVNNFENNAPDNAIITVKLKNMFIDFEISMLSWRNTFLCDIIGEKGSIHVNSLCKWGPSDFIFRKRKLPSGKPVEYKKTLIKKDPTWSEEYKYFKKLCKSDSRISLDKDKKISKILNELVLS